MRLTPPWTGGDESLWDWLPPERDTTPFQVISKAILRMKNWVDFGGKGLGLEGGYDTKRKKHAAELFSYKSFSTMSQN